MPEHVLSRFLRYAFALLTLSRGSRNACLCCLPSGKQRLRAAKQGQQRLTHIAKETRLVGPFWPASDLCFDPFSRGQEESSVDYVSSSFLGHGESAQTCASGGSSFGARPKFGRDRGRLCRTWLRLGRTWAECRAEYRRNGPNSVPNIGRLRAPA